MARPTKEEIEKRDRLFSQGKHQCGACCEVKAVSFFGAHKSAKYGIQRNCKPCTNARNLEYIQKYREEMGDDAWLAKKRKGLEAWKKNTRHKRIDHFKMKERESNLKHTYGISIHDFNVMLANQDGLCGICATPKPQRTWHVDHCHDSGEIRGILCNLCNVGLGAFKENSEALSMAMIYLRPRSASC